MVNDKTVRTLFLLATLACLAAPPPVSAALQAFVDRNPVAEDESFTLTLESGGDLDGSPDLSPLRRDFDVEGQARSSSISIINGSMSRTSQWRIQLMAKHSGRLTIPPISVGGERSPSLTLTVTPAGQPSASAADGGLFLEVSVKPHTVYVQQQILYTVRLFSAVTLANGSSLSGPSPPGGDAVVEKLGEDKHYQAVRNGMRYQVTERSYALYPQKSGDLAIPPLVLEGDIVQNGGGGLFAFDPFNQSVRHKHLRSQAEHVTVKPIPAAFHGSHWLPARSLQLEEVWAPDPPRFRIGQPATRTVAIMADGLTASQLPVLAGVAVKGLKQYPDQPSLKDTQANDGVTGLRTQKIAYIPTQAGEVTLPAIEIPWWNTDSDRQEVARLPARTFTIPPAPGSAANPPPPPAPDSTTPQSTPAATARAAQPPPPQTQSVSDRWPWIALVLGCAWLATLAAWWRHSRRTPGRAAPPAGVAEDESLRRVEKSLKAGCLANDAAAAKAAVLAWARRRWPEHPPLSLTAVARRCPPPLSEALIELDRTLYAHNAASWHGQSLWLQFAAHKHQRQDAADEHDAGLEPLYRDGPKSQPELP
jgi:hypothetical protein